MLTDPDHIARLVEMGLPADLDITNEEFIFAVGFVDTGDVDRAAKLAGWVRPKPGISGRKSVNAVVEILMRDREMNKNRVATAQERKEILTRVMRCETDGEIPPTVNERLKAVELLGKIEGDFVERSQVTTEVRYVVEMPTAKLTAQEWSKQAIELTKTIDAQAEVVR